MTCKGKREVHIKSDEGYVKERPQLKVPGLEKIMILKRILKKNHLRTSTGLIWLITGTSGGMLQTLQLIPVLCKILETYNLAQKTLTSQERLYSM